MVGGEHRKERFSERLEGAQNQPQNRCYLPGTGITSEGYSPITLQGNWYEERSDAAYYDGRPIFVSGSDRKLWNTTYRDMVKPMGTPHSSTFNQLTMNEIVDRTKSKYPAHQPHLDPTQTETAKEAFISVSMATYLPPEVTLVAEREYVAPLLGHNPGSQALGVLARLRHQLLIRMPAQSAFPGNVARTVRRALRARCTDRRGGINAFELQQGLEDASIVISPPECVALVRWFDKTGSGTADVDVLVRDLRGALNDRREQIVRSVYKMLESLCTGDDLITLDFLARLVDINELPAVKSGSVQAAAALAAFTEQWDVRCLDAFISLETFLSFFGDASFEEKEDNLFELMMRNVWHLSGGNGKSMNSSCRCVRVVHLNGRITKEKIRNDIAMRLMGKNAEEAFMRSNLAQQGIKDVKTITVVDTAAA